MLLTIGFEGAALCQREVEHHRIPLGSLFLGSLHPLSQVGSLTSVAQLVNKSLVSLDLIHLSVLLGFLLIKLIQGSHGLEAVPLIG